MLQRTLQQRDDDQRPVADPGASARAGDATTALAAQSIACYIAEMCAGLIGMAEAAKLETLGYLLGIAMLEAESMSQKQD